MGRKEIEDKIKDLRHEIGILQFELNKIDREESEYWIGIKTVGDGDYWDEYIYLLGFTTKEKAKEDVEKIIGKYADYKLESVDKETWDKYYLWREYERIYSPMLNHKTNDSQIDETREYVKNKIDQICPVEYPSFMHIIKDNYERY